jgi:hypothetical protein
VHFAKTQAYSLTGKVDGSMVVQCEFETPLMLSSNHYCCFFLYGMHSVMDGLFASIEKFPESPHALEWKSTANHYLDQYIMEPNANPPGPLHTPLASQTGPVPCNTSFPYGASSKVRSCALAVNEVRGMCSLF